VFLSGRDIKKELSEFDFIEEIEGKEQGEAEPFVFGWFIF